MQQRSGSIAHSNLTSGEAESAAVTRSTHHEIVASRSAERTDNAASREELAGKLLPQLSTRLRAAFRRATADDINDAVEDAIVEYLARPQRFDVSRGVPLEAFLYVIARRKLSYLLRSRARRAAQELASVYTISYGDARPDSIRREGRRWRVLRQVLHATGDPAERAALRRWLAGSRDAELANTLKLTTCAPHEQARAIKRFKDRMRRRVRRALARERDALHTRRKKSHG